MSVRAIDLGARLPAPDEIATPRPRSEEPEALRLAPLLPASQRTREAPAASLAPPDRRHLGLLRASVERLAALDDLAGSLQGGEGEGRLDAIRGLATEIANLLACAEVIDRARGTRLPG